MDEIPPTAAMDPLAAMRQAMAKAEKAAILRAENKAKALGLAKALPLDVPEGGQAQSELEALADAAMAELAGPSLPLHYEHHSVEEGEDLDLLVALAAKDLHEESREEGHGDLILVRDPVPPPAWYTEAAEQALPEALKGGTAPVDLKMLIQALLVEIGDVKRTNAMLLEKLIGVEESMRGLRRVMRGQ